MIPQNNLETKLTIIFIYENDATQPPWRDSNKSMKARASRVMYQCQFEGELGQTNGAAK